MQDSDKAKPPFSSFKCAVCGCRAARRWCEVNDQWHCFACSDSAQLWDAPEDERPDYWTEYSDDD